MTLHWAKTIANHPDPIYGGGFRMVADRVAQEGFGPIWRAIRDGENPFDGEADEPRRHFAIPGKRSRFDNQRSPLNQGE